MTNTFNIHIKYISYQNTCCKMSWSSLVPSSLEPSSLFTSWSEFRSSFFGLRPAHLTAFWEFSSSLDCSAVAAAVAFFLFGALNKQKKYVLIDLRPYTGKMPMYFSCISHVFVMYLSKKTHVLLMYFTCIWKKHVFLMYI